MAEALLASPLVGRERPLESMRRWVAELAGGRGRAVLVEGEAGIGKSSLVRAASQHASAAGCQCIWAACDELSQPFPLLPLLHALDARPTIRDSELAGEAPPGDAGRGDRIDAVAAATQRLLALLDDACAAGRVLLVVDDLQWADPATVQVLGRLARSARQFPLLLVGAVRPVPHREDLTALRRAIEPAGLLRLHSLTGGEVAEFVERAVGGRPGPRLLRLAEGASGNPLYLTELLDALVRGKDLSVEGGCVEAATGDRSPESLAAAIADRLGFLTAPVRGLLRAAALLGVDFSVSELAVVSGRRVNDLVPLLDEAILAGVLRENGADLSFRHPLIRQALYDGMPTAVRAAWHKDAGRALAKNAAPLERVARQLLAALDRISGTGPADGWVVQWLVDNGQRLVTQAPHAAAPLLRWAVHCLPAGQPPHDLLACRLAGALYKSGDPAGAAHVASAALPHVTRSDVLVDLHWTLTQCHAMDGRSEEALDNLVHILESPGVEPRHRARLLVISARAQHSIGKVEAASRLAEAALVEAHTSCDRWAAGWALGVLAIVHVVRGESARALTYFEQALTEAEGDHGLADLRLVLRLNQASALGDLDQYDEAIGAAEHARRLADDAGNMVRLAQARSVLAELLFDVGRWDDALREVDPGAGGSKNPTVECNDRGMAATILYHRGDEAAAHHLAEAERYVDRIGDRVVSPLLLARSLGREVTDGPGAALAALLAGLSETAEETEETADLLADAVRLALAVGDATTAGQVARRAEALASGSEVAHRQAVAAHCQGLLRRDPALLAEAADRYRAAGRPLPRAQALEAAALAHADGGDTAAARTRFTEAFSIYTELGARWDLARTQATFRGYGIRRGPRVRHRRSQQGWDSLTPTEAKVVELVARGMSNPEIAAHLFLSRRTVQTHVSHILSKLGLNSRIDIAREASRRGVQPE
jgi:ATP/maltotriose-dependent transcriptional regulator MalT